MKLPVRIKGYAGEHDEMGAYIVDANDEPVCSTAPVKSPLSQTAWKEYHKTAERIVEALNGTAVAIEDSVDNRFSE